MLRTEAETHYSTILASLTLTYNIIIAPRHTVLLRFKQERRTENIHYHILDVVKLVHSGI